MNVKECYDWLWKQSLAAAEEWYKLQVRDPYLRLYLWHKRGSLKIAAERPEGYDLSVPNRFMPNRTKWHVASVIFEVAKKLPCLPEEPVYPVER